ncbi:MAG: DNA-directed DNA polymerase eta rad30 [Pycnora praestabilis]|nr:MAG: DNA-directed DNA polymerase eta rad30 [Pycnora praestabilis]
MTEAKKLCPDLIFQHVATWKEGDEKWAYHEDAAAHIATHKVSLDPYRLQSRRILTTIKEALPAPPLQRVEKASVDEVFLDLSAHIHHLLVERYPELNGPPPYDDPSENLPLPPTTALDWNTDALVDLDRTETEEDDPDWDDIATLTGSEIIRNVRKVILERLKYTCSAGVARNKMIAKLGSAHRKPNQQTIVRNRAIQHFLGDFEFTKIRNLGGKLGDQVVATFGTNLVQELLGVPVEQLKSKLGDDTGTWVFNIIRGEDYSEVNPRTEIKSMLSAKSFRPSINSSEQAFRWLRIFVADIFSRLVEEGVLENKRRPKTINLHHRQGGQMRSKQAPIPQGRHIDESILFDLAKNLLGQVVVEGRAWPCANLQLSVGGFEDGVSGNRGIGSFLVKGEEAKAMKPVVRSQAPSTIEETRPDKRRRIESGGIHKFFVKEEGSREEDNEEYGAPEFQSDTFGAQELLELVEEDPKTDLEYGGQAHSASESPSAREPQHSAKPLRLLHDQDDPFQLQQDVQGLHQTSITSYICERCNGSMSITEKEEHDDWHFARDLQAQERGSAPVTESPTTPSTELNISSKPNTVVGRSNPKGKGLGGKKPGTAGTSHGGSTGKTEKGQRKLAFGR